MHTQREGQPYLADHFGSLESQIDASRLGMWMFLGTEVLLFGPLFTAYALYRFLYPAAFQAASHHLDIAYGTINTLILITSSLTVAMAVHFAKVGKNKRVVAMIVLSLLAGFAFLGIKSVEYAHKFHEGALPGKYYALEAVKEPGASLFFAIYFLATGVHALHVIIGMSVLVWIGWRAARNTISPEYYVPVELGGMYWHLVDLIWIFLYPLLYLI